MILNFAERSLTEGCNSKRLVSELSNVGTKEEIFLYFSKRLFTKNIYIFIRKFDCYFREELFELQ